MFNRKYIFIHGGCSIVMLVFGVVYLLFWQGIYEQMMTLVLTVAYCWFDIGLAMYDEIMLLLSLVWKDYLCYEWMVLMFVYNHGRSWHKSYS